MYEKTIRKAVLNSKQIRIGMLNLASRPEICLEVEAFSGDRAVYRLADARADEMVMARLWEKAIDPKNLLWRDLLCRMGGTPPRLADLTALCEDCPFRNDDTQDGGCPMKPKTTLPTGGAKNVPASE